MDTQEATARKIASEVENAIGVPDFVEIARQAYNAYGRTTNFKNFKGDTLTAWENLPELVRVAWTAAIKYAMTTWVQSVAGDLGCFMRARAKGEPTFTLRAQDKSSFAAVVFWILNNSGAPVSKLQEALRIADMMREWPDQKEAD